MALVMRMRRTGRRNLVRFRVVVADSRSPRDGRFIEEVGYYNPTAEKDEDKMVLKQDRVSYWLGQGCQPSNKMQYHIDKLVLSADDKG